jgi:hypothetical protein
MIAGSRRHSRCAFVSFWRSTLVGVGQVSLRHGGESLAQDCAIGYQPGGGGVPRREEPLPTSAYADLQMLHDPDHVLQEAPVTSEIIDAMLKVSRVDIPDMPDRIVAATAVYFGVPAISRDSRIRTSSVQTVW